MKSLTTIRSRILDITGVTDIGRKSDGWCGDATLAIGLIVARFHCLGTTDEEIDRFIMSASGRAKNGAPICRYHAGRPSKPVAVGLSLSKISEPKYGTCGS